MKMSKDKSFLSFTLYNGANYEETNKKNYRDTTLQLQKIDFTRQELYIPLENYAFEKSDSARFDDEVKSMNLKQLYPGQDSIGTLNFKAMADNVKAMRNTRSLRFSSQLDSAVWASRQTHFLAMEEKGWKDLDVEMNACVKAKDIADEM